MAEFTNEQKYKAANREVGKRKWVYAQLVARGKLSRQDADYEIAIMQEVAQDYYALLPQEPCQPDLFDEDDGA